MSFSWAVMCMKEGFCSVLIKERICIVYVALYKHNWNRKYGEKVEFYNTVVVFTYGFTCTGWAIKIRIHFSSLTVYNLNFPAPIFGLTLDLILEEKIWGKSWVLQWWYSLTGSLLQGGTYRSDFTILVSHAIVWILPPLFLILH